MLSVQETRQLERLAIRGRSASPAAAAAMRQTAATGHGLDFHDFRHYQPGDDPRRIDWTIEARHRQLVVRQFRAEGHLSLHLLVDVSRSMTLGSPAKIECAMKLASALGFVATERGDAIGAATFDDRPRMHVPAATGRAQLFRVLDALRTAAAGKSSGIDRALQSFGAMVRGPGVVVMLSDFFEPGLTLDGIRYLLYRGLTPALVQIVSDDELTPAFSADEPLELVDIEQEAARPIVVDRGAVERYLQEMSSLETRLSNFCDERALPWVRAVSSASFPSLLGACVRAGLLATVS